MRFHQLLQEAPKFDASSGPALRWQRQWMKDNEGASRKDAYNAAVAAHVEDSDVFDGSYTDWKETQLTPFSPDPIATASVDTLSPGEQERQPVDVLAKPPTPELSGWDEDEADYADDMAALKANAGLGDSATDDETSGDDYDGMDPTEFQDMPGTSSTGNREVTAVDDFSDMPGISSTGNREVTAVDDFSELTPTNTPYDADEFAGLGPKQGNAAGVAAAEKRAGRLLVNPSAGQTADNRLLDKALLQPRRPAPGSQPSKYDSSGMGSESPSGWNKAFSMDDLAKMKQNAGILAKPPQVDNDGGEVGGVQLSTPFKGGTTKYADTGEAPSIEKKTVFTKAPKQTGRENNQSGGSAKFDKQGKIIGKPFKGPFTKAPKQTGRENNQSGGSAKFDKQGKIIGGPFKGPFTKAPKPTEGGRD